MRSGFWKQVAGDVEEGRCAGRASQARCWVALGALIISSLGAAEASVSGVQVVEQGVSRAVIVIPTRAEAVVQAAAEELQWHLERVTGARLPILPEADAEDQVAGPALFLGATEAAAAIGLNAQDLAANGYRQQQKGEHLFLVGRDAAGEPLDNFTPAGTLFGVYDLLEEQLKIRWLWPGESGVQVEPAASVMLSLPAEAQKREPALRFSQWRAVHAALGDGARSIAQWQSEEAGRKFYQDQAWWLRRHRFGIGTAKRQIGSDLRVFHSFLYLWDKYGESNPEFFNLLPDGRRAEHPGRGRRGQAVTLCVSEPGLWRQLVADWQQSWRGRMGVHLLLGENDSPALCTCDRCRSWDTPDLRFESSRYWGHGEMYADRTPFLIPDVVGNATKWGWHGKLGPDPAPSVSDRYARFYREVQKEAEKIQPDAVVAGFAYLNYWKAPQQAIELNDRVVISFVPPTRVPYTRELSDEIRAQYDGWRRTGAQLYLRPNLPAAHNLPVAYGRRLVEDLLYMAREGLLGNDYDSIPRAHFGTQGPSAYALARANTVPQMSVDAMYEEYFGFFGPAADAVRAYFEHWEEVSSEAVDLDLAADMFGVVGDAELSARDLAAIPNWFWLCQATFTPQVLARGQVLLEAAVAAAGTDAATAERVAWLEAAFRDARLTAEAIALYLDYRRTGGRDEELKARCKEAYQQVRAYRAEIESLGLGDFSARYRAEQATLGRL